MSNENDEIPKPPPEKLSWTHFDWEVTSEITEDNNNIRLSGSSVYDKPPTLKELRIDVLLDAAEVAHNCGQLWNPFNIKMVIRPNPGSHIQSK